jgi:hypothetical protein
VPLLLPLPQQLPSPCKGLPRRRPPRPDAATSQCLPPLPLLLRLLQPLERMTASV